ncbi:hypothetical protein AB0M68_04555 [Streptomyces sp. NPDC051453]|uniref:hypothetical protein n=1 Tax=Streptomyces sp. NPDC051453 TaxID=3154941 RepID=UPI00344197E7
MSVEAARRLGEMSARWGLPVKSLLLAANSVAVGAAWETETPAVGLLLDGRPERTGADVTLCLFLNQLPMRPDLRDADWRTAARRALDAENALLRTAHRRPAPLPAPDAAFDVRVRVPVPPASQLPGQSAITPCFTGSWRIARDIVATSGVTFRTRCRGESRERIVRSAGSHVRILHSCRLITVAQPFTVRAGGWSQAH